MNYSERKLALGIAPTAIDLGFEPEQIGVSSLKQSPYLKGKYRTSIVVPKPELPSEDLSHLNPRNSRRMQRLGRRKG